MNDEGTVKKEERVTFFCFCSSSYFSIWLFDGVWFGNGMAWKGKKKEIWKCEKITEQNNMQHCDCSRGKNGHSSVWMEIWVYAGCGAVTTNGPCTGIFGCSIPTAVKVREQNKIVNELNIQTIRMRKWVEIFVSLGKDPW